MELLGKYVNGNYTVSIYDDGTKVRENDLDFFTPDTIESLDLKITNCCDMGCAFCHENSKRDGAHGDILSESFIDRLHPYTELAIGGGNPLEHPDLVAFLTKCKELKLIPSMTVNQVHFMQNIDFIRSLVYNKLIYGLGISLVDANEKFIETVKEFDNAVIHVINGVVRMSELQKLSNNGLKILILGYKEFRRGRDNYVEQTGVIEARKSLMRSYIKGIIDEGWFDVVSFDNLALNQLRIQQVLSKEEWDDCFMGNDGEFTMYVDMVERKFAKNSCVPEEQRLPLMDTIEEMFAKVKEDKNEDSN